MTRIVANCPSCKRTHEIGNMVELRGRSDARGRQVYVCTECYNRENAEDASGRGAAASAERVRIWKGTEGDGAGRGRTANQAGCEGKAAPMPRCRHCERRTERVWPCTRNGAKVHVCEGCFMELFGRPPSGEPADPADIAALAACRKCGHDTDGYGGVCPACGADQYEDGEWPAGMGDAI